jgi:hypothetical protein
MLKKVAKGKIGTIRIVPAVLASRLRMSFSSAGQTSEIFEKG